MSDLRQRVARKLASFEYGDTIDDVWMSFLPEADAAMVIVLEEAAKLMEERTLRNRKIYALQNGMRDYVRRCEHAAAIRKLGEK